ncbi:Protein-lysine methyltransferase METTL21B [Rhynchospora pubera]|uniref:Protein-lysine methyltransferase METTL21B n=1 Tax=Rhynchospora pubera TaxID=906938 RepID=A0AAV8D8S1_9POAL|nr:Protein-lysine methyltransferase METTL21B [Rhynchospora pubera]
MTKEEALQRKGGDEDDDEGMISLDSSFFVDRNYELTEFTFGSNSLQLLCLRSASTDYDLTGQLVWPGAVLMNNYLSNHAEILSGRSVIELGSGIGITGILCSRFCKEVVLTDHNDEVLEIIRKNIELEASRRNQNLPGLTAKKLEWGNREHIQQILQTHHSGFDIVLGADIYILFEHFMSHLSFQQSSVPHLFDTVQQLLQKKRTGCKFIPAYVSRAKTMDTMVMNEAIQRGMQISEVEGTRTTVSGLEGVIFEVAFKS